MARNNTLLRSGDELHVTLSGSCSGPTAKERQQYLSRLSLLPGSGHGIPLRLKWDGQNPYDADAIEVWCEFEDEPEFHLGFIENARSQCNGCGNTTERHREKCGLCGAPMERVGAATRLMDSFRANRLLRFQGSVAKTLGGGPGQSFGLLIRINAYEKAAPGQPNTPTLGP